MQIILQRLQRTDNTVGSRFHLFQFGNLLITQHDTPRFHHRKTCNCMTNMLDIFSNIQTGFRRNDKRQNNSRNSTMNAGLQK